VKLDKEGRRLCEYPYCKNYAESKGVRNGERRYRPWCERHRYEKARAKSQPLKPKLKAVAKARPKAQPKARVKRRVRSAG